MNKNLLKNYKFLYDYSIKEVESKTSNCLEIKIKKKFLLNYKYFYRSSLPKPLSEEEIKKYKKIKCIYIKFRKINKRKKIPIEEFNLWTSIYDKNTRVWLERAYFEGLQKLKSFLWQPFVYFFKKLYEKFSIVLLKYVLIDGSFPIMLHGLRKSSDIDIAVVYPNLEKRKKLDDFIINMKKNIKGTKLDIYLKDKILWENNTPNVLNKNAQEKGIKNYDTMVTSKKYSFYFYGIKIINLELYIEDVSKRRYPKNVYDTIQARRKLGLKYPLKPLEDKIKIVNKIYNPSKFIKTVTFYFKKFLNEDVTEKQVKLFLAPHFKLYKEKK